MELTSDKSLPSASSFSIGLFATLTKLKCGLFSGIGQAAIFNPWDRALYLSVKNSRPFLHMSNFEAPFQGLMQTITQRAISSGLYFPLEEIFRESFLGSFDNTSITPICRMWITFFAGNTAGAMNGILMNPVTAIKYHYWGITECGKENFFTTAYHMYQKGGHYPFFIGSSATISRDLIFGGVFALLRHEMHLVIDKPHKAKKNDFAINIASGMLATIVSSPLNYIRNMHYATPPGVKCATFRQVLGRLWEEAKLEPTLLRRTSLILSQLRIGWGTARVGCGMGVGAYLYSLCSHHSF